MERIVLYSKYLLDDIMKVYRIFSLALLSRITLGLPAEAVAAVTAGRPAGAGCCAPRSLSLGSVAGGGRCGAGRAAPSRPCRHLPGPCCAARSLPATRDCPGPDMARGQQKIQSQQKNAKKQAGQKKKQGHDQKAAAKAALIYTCTVCRTQMPDPKTFKQHFESKHPKTPLPPELADVQA